LQPNKNPDMLYPASKEKPRESGRDSSGAYCDTNGTRNRRVLALYQHCFGTSNSTIPNEMSRASTGGCFDGYGGVAATTSYGLPGVS
jgi:hypothetical protein